MKREIKTQLDTGITTLIVKEGSKQVVYVLENRDIVKSKESWRETVKFFVSVIALGGVGLLITYLFDI